MTPEAKIGELLKTLGRRGCDLQVGAATPYRPNSQSNFNELWTDLGLDKDEKYRWLHMNPDTPYAGMAIGRTGDTILRLLGNNCPETWRCKTLTVTDGEIHGLGDPESSRGCYTNGQFLNAVHALWRDGYQKELDECIALVERVHKARIDASSAPKRAVKTPPHQPEAPLQPPLPDGAQLLTLPERSDPLPLEVRRRLFLRSPEWQYVCAGGYSERPVTDAVLKHALSFLDTVPDRFDHQQLQLLWIGGRSGDGKSILLLQTIAKLLQFGRPERFLRFRSPDQLIEWLGQTDLKLGTPGTDAPLILVADDLHKCADWRRARVVFEQMAASGTKIAIMTCGPTPERGLFKAELGELLALTNFDVPMIGEEDHQVFAEFLELELASDRYNASQTLVEHLFLALRRDNASLDAFAESLRDRVDRFADHAGLFKRLITMTLLDLDLPTTNVASVSAEAWLTQLASDTQLHVGVSELGYRFGHPAIASALFDVVTRKPGVPRTIEDRLVEILVEILAVYPRDRMRLAIRQIRGRARSIGADPYLVIRSLFAKASTADLRRNATFALLGQARHGNEAVGAELIAIARAARDNVLNPPEDRADLASLLAISNSSSAQDQQQAVDYLVDRRMGPWMDIFIHWLSSKPAAKLRRARFKEIATWILRNPRKGVSTTILTKLLNERTIHPRLRTLVLDHLDEVGVGSLNTSYISTLASNMENILRDDITEWLDINSKENIVNVYAALLNKPGSVWHDQTYIYLDSLDWERKKIIKVVSMLIRHLDSAKVSDPALAASVDARLSDLFTRSLKSPDADDLFMRLAQSPETQFVDLIEERLCFLESAQPEGSKAFMELLKVAWPKLSGPYPARAQDVARIMRQVVAVDTESKDARAVISFAQQILENSRTSLTGLTDALVKLFDQLPHGLIRGLVACRLLEEVSNPNGVKPEYQRLVSRRHEFRSEVLLCAKSDDDECRTRGNFGRSLIDAMLPQEFDEIKALMEAKRGYSLKRRDSVVIVKWLKHKAGRNHAINIICDGSFNVALNVRIRSSCAARSLSALFSCFDDLRQSHQAELQKLLEQGIGDFEWNKDAALSAWQLRDRWPQVAEKHIWCGILTAAIDGDALDTREFIDAFTDWQAVHKDEQCQEILSRSLLLESRSSKSGSRY